MVTKFYEAIYFTHSSLLPSAIHSIITVKRSAYNQRTDPPLCTCFQFRQNNVQKATKDYIIIQIIASL